MREENVNILLNKYNNKELLYEIDEKEEYECMTVNQIFGGNSHGLSYCEDY